LPGPTHRSPSPLPPNPASAALLRSARRLLRRKERKLTGRFLAEGRSAVSEALADPAYVVEILVADDVVDRHADLLSRAASVGVRVSQAPAAAVAGVSDTVTPQGLVAICSAVGIPLADSLTDSARLVVLCDRIRDPGNLGTVIRCADAFGADAVLVSGDSVDPYNAKAVRASTGSLFHLPVVTEVDLVAAVTTARSVGLQVFGADGAASCTIEDLSRSGELARPTMWVLGNEAWGLPADRTDLLDRLVALPMYGRAESLNLSTAAAVLLYATASAQRASER
jgi:RNA methyltransferase, TrmH family